MLDDLRGDNGDMKETTAEQVRDESSCEKKLHNGDAADENDAREENGGEGKLPLQTQKKTQDRHPRPQSSYPQPPKQTDMHNTARNVGRAVKMGNRRHEPQSLQSTAQNEVEEATVTIPHGL